MVRPKYSNEIYDCVTEYNNSLDLISERYSREEIAKSPGNSKKTIDSIRIEMLNRFQVRNAAQLVAYGFKKKRLK